MSVLRGAALRERLLSVPLRDRDALADALLGLDPPPDDAADLPRGSVPYLPCGVEEILALVSDAPVRPDDTLVDLGSGLGRVAMLVHLLTGARTSGLEIQGHLVERARERCRALGLADVSFVHADAAKTELDGSIFFLYAPFNGAMLTAVLGRLEEVARRRSIVVATVDLELRDVTWLRPRPSPTLSLRLHDSHGFVTTVSVGPASA